MSTTRTVLTLALIASATACYQESAYAQGTTFPQQDPQVMQGPPGGEMDPQYQVPQQPDPQQYQDPNVGYADPNAQQAPVDDQQPPAEDDSQYAEGPVTDEQIDSTLDGYGSWIQDEDYGRIWVPSATVVGADFTPYETDGSWVYSDAGWMFTCGYDWGWLPFHYGRWGWFDGYWGWVPGYNWGPAWVDWRYGGGYVGWRPLAPEYRGGGYAIRDHRHQAQVMDSHWRFAPEREMGSTNIRSHELRNPGEGLRLTQPMRPPHPQGVVPVRSAAIMQAHMPARSQFPSRSGSVGHGPVQPPHQIVGAQQPHNFNVPQAARGPQAYGPYHNPQSYYRPPQQPAFRQPPPQYRQPSYQVPQQAYRPQQPPAYQRPTYPGSTYQRPTYVQPSRPTYQQPTYQRPTYVPPSRPTYQQPTYQRPTYVQPSRPTYQAPVNTYRPAPSYHAPSYSAPSHSYSAPSHSYSAPSHSSGGGYHGGGGGGHHR